VSACECHFVSITAFLRTRIQFAYCLTLCDNTVIVTVNLPWLEVETGGCCVGGSDRRGYHVPAWDSTCCFWFLFSFPHFSQPGTPLRVILVRKEFCPFGTSCYLTPMILSGKLEALRPQTPQRVWDDWSHYTDTSEPVVDYGAINIARPIRHSNKRPFG
jgi:hypothetical protein